MNVSKWLTGLLRELSVEPAEAPCVYGDNQSAQALSKNDIKSERTKHIDIKYHFVQDEISSGKLRLEWIPTEEQVADILTKALGGPAHKELRDKLIV